MQSQRTRRRPSSSRMRFLSSSSAILSRYNVSMRQLKFLRGLSTSDGELQCQSCRKCRAISCLFRASQTTLVFGSDCFAADYLRRLPFFDSRCTPVHLRFDRPFPRIASASTRKLLRTAKLPRRTSCVYCGRVFADYQMQL